MIIKRLLTGAIKIITLSFISLTFVNGFTFASENVDYNVSVASSLTLTIPTSSIVLNLDPSSKTFDSKNLTVSVGTNNKTGYTLTLSTPNNNTDLNRDSSGDSIVATMPTLSAGTYTQATFTEDKWGYSINSNTAIPSTVTSGYVPFVSGNTLMERSTAVNNDETELTFAAKIDYLQPAGSYSTELSFNIVANPLVEYLQNWTGCSSMGIGDTTTLVDNRDNEKYLVGRLADGNCWTLENLRLDLTNANVQANLTEDTTNATAASLTSLKNNIATSWSSTYTVPSIDTSYKDSVQAASGYAPEGQIGVYYNFCAASAGSYCYAQNAGAGNASQDVCPKGWHLPTAYSTKGSYRYLYNTAYSGNIADFMSALSTPLSGVPRGTYGIFWTSTVYNKIYIYNPYVTSSAFYERHSGYRNNGHSIRCVLEI